MTEYIEATEMEHHKWVFRNLVENKLKTSAIAAWAPPAFRILVSRRRRLSRGPRLVEPPTEQDTHSLAAAEGAKTSRGGRERSKIPRHDAWVDCGRLSTPEGGRQEVRGVERLAEIKTSQVLLLFPIVFSADRVLTRDSRRSVARPIARGL